MRGFLVGGALRRALLTKEGLAVLLAFLLTVGVYGALFYSLVAPRGEGPVHRLRASATLLFHDGAVWRLSIPLPADAARAGIASVSLALSGAELQVLLGDRRASYGGIAIAGSLASSVASGAVTVGGLGLVDMIVYVDPDGRLSIVVDDDLDGRLDETHLVRFVQGVGPVAELDLEGDTVATVPRGSAVPLECLDVALAASASASPKLVVRDGPAELPVNLVEVLRNVKRPVAYVVSTEGSASLAIVLPYGLLRGGAEVSVKIVAGGMTLAASLSVPEGLVGSGRVTVSTW